MEGKFSISTNEEMFIGDYDSREEAIAAGPAEVVDADSERGVFWVGEQVPPMQPEDYWDADDWMEHVACQDAYRGDHAEDWGRCTKEQRDELEMAVRKVMAEWLDHHKLRPDFFNITNVTRHEVPPKVSE